MKAVTRITFFDENGEKFFGEGPARLLRAVEETGSLRSAAMSMGMAYTKALRLLHNAEAALGYPMTRRSVGGKDGGGSSLTAEGAAWLARYEAYRDACCQANETLYRQFFPEQVPARTGCVIMASGLGKRFGGNKLLADFMGEPMICRALAATEGLFARRVVVTRHQEVADLCQKYGIDVKLHDLPHRSDTVRLGLEAVGEVEQCMFCPADQPLLRRETVEALVGASHGEPDCIWRTAFQENPGAPVIFPRWAFDALRTLPEGKGGGYVIKQHTDRVRTIPVSDPYELMDVDSPENLKELLNIANSREETP